jgi:nitrogenase iron protein NifH
LLTNALRIAIYGKGGIGKSTIAANLAAAMAATGAKVLQIGCDPKQDSTRVLLSGRHLTTVLDYLKTTQPLKRTLDDVVETGYGGVACVEAGGPEPGVGCAGRGILSTFDLLEQLNIAARHFDVTLYDVLGDVVCGGFAVPLRDDYAEIVYIVTSGEFMALYAANNILRGVRNFEANGPRVGGIILNCRGLDDEEARVRRFADATHIPIVGAFPRSALFAEAERATQPIRAAFPDSDVAASFSRLASYVLNEAPRHAALPLPADELEPVVLGSTRQSKQAQRPAVTEVRLPEEATTAPVPLPVRARRYCSKGVRDHATLFGCAFNGAAHTALQLSDAVVVAHGPRSCAFLSSLGTVSSMRRRWRRYGPRAEFSPVAELLNSDMDERVVIFGGNDGLETALRRAAQRHPAVIVLVTTCSAGIIGDDLRVSQARAHDALDGIPVVTLQADGDLNGDYSQGVLDASTTIAERYIDPQVTAEGDTVNIVGEKNLVNQTDTSYRTVERLLESIGVGVNCRFLRQCNTETLAGFQKARLNLLAYDDLFGRTLRRFFEEHYGVNFASTPFPLGFRQTERWLLEIGVAFDRRDLAERCISAHRARYEHQLNLLRPALAGKRVFIVTQNRHIDWVLDTALDLGMEIVRVGVLDSVWDDEVRTRYGGRIPFVVPYQRDQRLSDIRELRPDLTLTDFRWNGAPESARISTIPFGFDAGFYSGLTLAERWRDILRAPAQEGWRHDL